MGFTTLLTLVLVPVTLLLVKRIAFSTDDNKNFPPGPPTVPYFGNLREMAVPKPFVSLADLGRKYGSHGLLGLRFGPGGNAVIINTWKSARDLLDMRGAIYSSRPHVPTVEYIVPPPGNLHPVFMPYGEKWRKTRKTIVNFLKDDVVDKLLPIQDAESSQMMWELMHDPERWGEHVMRCFGAVVMASVFGTRGKTFDGGRVKQFFTVMKEWTAILSQGAVPPYEFFPFLRYVPDFLTPWRGWQKQAASVKTSQSALYHGLFEDARARVDAGQAQDSFVAELLRDWEDNNYITVQLEYITGFLMEAGADTTACVLHSFILAMATHPAIQNKAQEEVDRVFGTDGVRLDRTKQGDLPYVTACLLETMRWRPPVPFAIPHATTQDDVYHGHVIPAHTTVHLNVWAVHHDPDEYENPDDFNPDRFLSNPLGTKNKTSEEAKTAMDEGMRRVSYAFGASRRVCAGQRMAENSMMLAMSKLLWSFDVVSPEKLDTGIYTAFTDAVLTEPKHFSVEFRPRDEHRASVVEETWKKADGYLKQFE